LAFRQGQFSWGFPSILHSPTCRPRRLNSCRKPLLTPFRFFITYAKSKEISGKVQKSLITRIMERLHRLEMY